MGRQRHMEWQEEGDEGERVLGAAEDSRKQGEEGAV